MIRNYRISVDGQFYTGESECFINTYTNAAWSNNSFQTKRVQRNVLTFELKENNNFKVITGTTNLIGEIKKIIQFISMTGLLAGNEITIEAEPYKIPLELNIDYFLGLESELSRQKEICAEMKKQLDIATDLGQKRFERIEELKKECNQEYKDKNALADRIIEIERERRISN
jgi:hypothetical protein